MLLPVLFLYSAHFGLKMVLTGKIHVTITAPVRHRYRAVRWSSDPDCRLSVLLKVMKDWWLYSSALNLSQHYLEKPLWFLNTGYTDVAQQTIQSPTKEGKIHNNLSERSGTNRLAAHRGPNTATHAAVWHERWKLKDTGVAHWSHFKKTHRWGRGDEATSGTRNKLPGNIFSTWREAECC